MVRPAFTLVEIMVVGGVIAILIALLLPALRQSRKSADSLASITMQRSLLASIHLYATDHRDALPYLGVPSDPLATFTFHGWTDPIGLHYFTQNKAYWLSLVYGTYCEPFPGAQFDRDLAHPFFESVLTPPLRPSPMVRSCFWLTHASAAAAPFWGPDESLIDTDDLRGTRMPEVSYSSRKGLLLDVSVGVFNDHATGSGVRAASVGFADGSSGWKPWPESMDPDRVAHRPQLGTMPWLVMSTRGGLSGIDF